MSIDLGTFGIWRWVSETTPEMAAAVEKMGFGALWIGGSPAGHLNEIEGYIDGSDRIPVVTGIVNMWRDDADTVGRSYLRIAAAHPNRFLLGVGVGHPESTEEYQSPYQKMVDYLDRLETLGVPKEGLVVAALGPRALALSVERTVGAHPYLTSPIHTRMARELMGPDALLAPEQKVILETDVDLAREQGRRIVKRYLGRINYRNNLLREGWTEADLENEGSDRLIDALVLHGEVDQVAVGIRAHLEAGADHVCIQVIGDDVLASYEKLAAVLLD